MTQPRSPKPRRSPRSSVPAVALTTEDRIAELEARLAEMESPETVRQRSRRMMDRVVPPDAQRHFRNAGREQLMGVRSIVDHWIGRLDAADERADQSPRGRESIQIE